MEYKYFKYKIKYLELKDNMIHQNNNHQIGGNKDKYLCNPDKEFKNICIKDTKGLYNSQNSCMNECEGKYINNQLISAKMKMETLQFQHLISDLIKDKVDVYIKGGNVLGLHLLKLIYDKYPGDNFEKYFNKFLELNLIRDWDFVGYTSKTIDKQYMKTMDKLARKHQLVSRAKTFILYQSNRGIKIDDQALFEISILDNENYSGMEHPSTTLKSKVNTNNLKYIFMLAKCFYSFKLNKKKIDMDLVKHIMKKIDFKIYPYLNGLYNMNNKTFDNGDLNVTLLKFIKYFSDKNMIGNRLNTQQFLISHIKEPNRMLYRLVEKNIPKTKKVTKFLKDNMIKVPTWLFDSDKVEQLINLFIEKLGKFIYSFYNTEYNQTNNMLKALNKVDMIFTNVKLTRIQEGIDKEEFKETGIKLIQLLFKDLYPAISSDILTIPDTNKLGKILKYLHRKNILK